MQCYGDRMSVSVRDQSRSASISVSLSLLFYYFPPSSEFQSFVHLLDFMQPFHMLSFYIYAMLCDYHIAQPHDVIMMSSFMPVSSLFH